MYKRLLPFLFLFSSQVLSQDFDPYIQEKVDQLSYDSLYLRLQQFENLGIKEIGTQELENTGNWILNLYQQFGYTNIEIDSFYIGPNLVYNIIVTKVGTDHPDTYLIVDGHYDTANGPGVNDNGSGTACILEVANMMKDIETSYSIKFIHFTAEEIGLIGSNHYVENIVIPQLMDIRLVLNIDEVGGVAGEVNNTVTCERDEWDPAGNNAASAAFTDTLANLTEMYTALNTTISYAYGSDYVPFMNNNYVVTGFYETNESPYPHTINDNLSNLDPDYVFEVTKASLAATLYFSNHQNSLTSTLQNSNIHNAFTVAPNPFKEFFEFKNPMEETIQLKLFDLTGKMVFQSNILSNEILKLAPKCKPGLYLIYISSLNGDLIHLDKVIKQ